MLIYRFIGLLAQAGADLSVYRFIGLSAQAGADLSVYRFIGLSAQAGADLSVYRFIGLSAQAGADLSVYRFIGLSAQAGKNRPCHHAAFIYLESMQDLVHIMHVPGPFRPLRDQSMTSELLLALTSKTS